MKAIQIPFRETYINDVHFFQVIFDPLTLNRSIWGVILDTPTYPSITDGVHCNENFMEIIPVCVPAISTHF